MDERFETVERLQLGGMGELKKVRHKTLGTFHYVKAFRVEAGSADEGEADVYRCAREMARLRGLDSVLPLNDMFHDGSTGEECIVFAYVEGSTLEERLAEQRSFPVDEAIDITRRLCEPLLHAHELSPPVVHGEVYPGNVLFERTTNRLVLLGFGMSGATFDENQTLAIQEPGRMLYAAPEVLTSGVATVRSDIYSVGHILHELVTGTHLRAGTDLLEMYRSVNTELEVPTRPDLPEAITEIVRKCVRVNPEERPGSVQDVVAALERAASSEGDPQEVPADSSEDETVAISLRDVMATRAKPEAAETTPPEKTAIDPAPPAEIPPDPSPPVPTAPAKTPRAEPPSDVKPAPVPPKAAPSAPPQGRTPAARDSTSTRADRSVYVSPPSEPTAGGIPRAAVFATVLVLLGAATFVFWPRDESVPPEPIAGPTEEGGEERVAALPVEQPAAEQRPASSAARSAAPAVDVQPVDREASVGAVAREDVEPPESELAEGVPTPSQQEAMPPKGGALGDEMGRRNAMEKNEAPEAAPEGGLEPAPLASPSEAVEAPSLDVGAAALDSETGAGPTSDGTTAAESEPALPLPTGVRRLRAPELPVVVRMRVPVDLEIQTSGEVERDEEEPERVRVSFDDVPEGRSTQSVLLVDSEGAVRERQDFEIEHIPGWQLRSYADSTGEVYSLRFTPDGSSVITGGRDNLMKVWPARKDGEPRVIEGHGDWVEALDVSRDGTMVVSGSRDKTVRIWSLEDGTPVQEMRGHEGWVNAVAFAPDGQTVVSGSDDRTVRIWDVATGEERRRLEGHDDWVLAVAYARNGSMIASAGKDNVVRLWDPETGKPVGTLSGATDWLSTVAFTLDGGYVAAGSDDRKIRVWETRTGSLVQTLAGHRDWVTSVDISPDGYFLVSSSRDKTVRIWEIASGEQVRLFKGHRMTVPAVSFSPDGEVVASGSRDKTVRIWWAGPEEAPSGP